MEDNLFHNYSQDTVKVLLEHSLYEWGKWMKKQS